MKMLALVIDAYGADGGIAQYNRDFLEAAADLDSIDRIDVFARIGDTTSSRCNPKIHVHVPVKGRLAYSLNAIRHSVHHRPNFIFNGHVYHGPLARMLSKGFGARLVSQLHGTEIWDK